MENKLQAASCKPQGVSKEEIAEILGEFNKRHYVALPNDTAITFFPHMFTRVIIESPFAGDVERNIAYARACVKDSLSRGEAPIASHLLYTQEGILNDNIPAERELGINAGLAWKQVAEKHVFYIDYGYSEGMLYAKQYSIEHDLIVEERTIYNSNENTSK